MREVSHPQTLDIHYRAPGVRTNPPSPVAQESSLSLPSTPRLSPRLAPLLPVSQDNTPLPSPVASTMEPEVMPTICGMPLKYVS